MGNKLKPPSIEKMIKFIPNKLNRVFTIYNKDITYGKYLLIKRNTL